MKTVLSVVGARPQFIKAAPLSRELRKRFREVLVHTGQHYDHGMSAVFFEELGIPEPDHDLGVGSGPHGAQTGAMMAALEPVLGRERPALVVVFGDTNSTLAGALTAAKLHIPIAHVEAGLRSFNRAMPEEINRIVADRLSDLLFAPSERAARQLTSEGLTQGVHVVGDIMHDAVLQHAERATASAYPREAGVEAGGYAVCTVHRAENTDAVPRLRGILDGLARLAMPVVLPLHPRTRKALDAAALAVPANVRALPPLGYLDMLRLVQQSALVLTDSGGLQKEAYYLGVPCVTLRDETEWTELVEAGWNVVAGTEPAAIARAAAHYHDGRPAERPLLYGDGRTAERIGAVLAEFLGT